MNAFGEFLQNAVTWLSEDECCELAPGQGVIPGILVASDWSLNALQYTPWPGVIRSYSHGSGSDSGCTDEAKFDDTVIIDTLHPLFASINDLSCGICGENSACSVDNSNQSVHALWEQGHSPCGYEDDGFVAIQRVERAMPQVIPPCPSDPPAACPSFSPLATMVTLVRDLPCCGLVEPRPTPAAACP